LLISYIKNAILPQYHIVLFTKCTVSNERVTLLRKVLGSSKVQANYRITLIREVQKKLDIKIGDIVIYIQNEKGDIILKKGEIKPI